MSVRGPHPTHHSTTYAATPRPVPGLLEFTIAELARMLWALLRLICRLIWRYPLPACAVAEAGLVVWAADTPTSIAPIIAAAASVAIGMLALVLVLARRIDAARTDAKWRKRTFTRFALSWPVLCDRVGLKITDRDRRTGAVTESVPGLYGLCWSENGTLLQGSVALVPGQVIDDLSETAERLADAAGAQRARITRTGPGQAELALLFADPRQQIVAPLPVSQRVDLAAVPIGIREDGQPWHLRVLGTHILIVGVTGAGKGSVIWSLLRGLAPAIAQHSVQVWAVDGKAGVELAPGADLFTRFATTIEDAVDLLEDAVAVMRERATAMAGHTRTHTPTPHAPMILVLVDEVALLTAYQPDRKLRERAEKALATLATQGRAPGVVLVAALQDPRKEVLGLRNLFPTKIAMRLDEKAQVDMVLGEGARDAGAACHHIPDTLPGVAFVKVDGVREPVRVRASYLTDHDITATAQQYRAPS